MKRIFAPYFRANKVTDITPAFLKQHNVRALILDLDGNLVGYQNPEVAPDVIAWLANILAEGIRVCIVSNPGAKSTLVEIASQLGLRAFKGAVPKPLPKAFIEAQRYWEV